MGGGEGWVVGKPLVLLHTTDSGKSWERIPLSPKLPGEPSGVTALGGSKAEMTTSTGAIYTTTNAGRNWKAEVKESIDATLNRVSSSGVSGASYYSGSVGNIKRAADGSYLSVASRGNFYLTWKPGDDFWLPHNRGTPRRIPAMGYVGNNAANGVWMTLNGGQMAIAGRCTGARTAARRSSSTRAPTASRATCTRSSSSTTRRGSLLARMAC